MSVDTFVFLKIESLPGPAQWQQAITTQGFDLQMETNFEMENQIGFLPCKIKGHETGFEYFFEKLGKDSLEEKDRRRLGDRDHMVTFTTHGDFAELLAATIASGVLCAMTDGMMLENGEPPFIPAGKAIQHTNKEAASLLKHIKPIREPKPPKIGAKLTVTQLDAFSDKWFRKEMIRRGYPPEKKFFFWRKKGPLYYVLSSEIVADGKALWVRAAIYSPWADDPDGNFVKFPGLQPLLGGTLSDAFPDDMASAQTFDVSSPEAIEASFAHIIKLVDERATDWFHAIHSYETFSAQLDRCGFQATPQERDLIKEKMAIGYEREPSLWL